MVIQRNNILDKESAKALEYNGKKLSDNEKKIFDDLVDPKLELVRDIAEVLEKVKEAQDATKFERSVFNYLAEAKRGKTDAVRAINNSNNKQFDSAFNYQLSLRPAPEKNENNEGKRDKEFLEKEIARLNTEVAGLDISIEEEQKFIDSVDIGGEDEKVREKDKELKILEDFKNLLEGEGVESGRPLYRQSAINLSNATNHLKEITRLQRELAGSESYETQMWQAGVPSFATEKGKDIFVNKRHLRSVNYQIVDILKSIGTNKIKAAINECVDAANKQTAIELWEGRGDKKSSEEMGIVEKSDWYISKRTNDVTSYKINTATYLHSLNGDKKSHLAIGKSGIKELNNYPDNSGTVKSVWPYRVFSDADFFRFMELLFPKEQYGSGRRPTGKDITAELGGDKKYVLNVGGLTKDIRQEEKYINLSGEEKKVQNFEFDNFVKSVFGENAAKELRYEKFELRLHSIIELYWSIYRDGDLITNYNSVTNTSKTLDVSSVKEEIEFIKAVRAAGIDKKLVSDEILLEVAEPTIVYYYHLVRNGRGSEGIKARNGAKHSLRGVTNINVSDTNITPNTSGDWRDYLDTTPLERRISRLRAEKNRLEKQKGSSDRIIDKHYENKYELEHSKQDKLKEIELLKNELKLLKSGGIEDVKKRIRELCKDKGRGNTRPEIDHMRRLLNELEDLEKTDQKAKGLPEVGIVDQDLKDIKTVLETLHNSLETHEKLAGRFETYGKTGRERALNKYLNAADLEMFKGAYEAIEGLRALSEEEKDNLKAIRDKISGNLKDDGTPTSDLTPEKLTILFNFTVDEALKNKWVKVDGKALKETDLNRIFLNDYGKGRGKYEALIGHLKEKGDVDNDKAYENDDDTKKAASWEKLLKKGPEKVIKTILIHENEDALADSPDKTKKAALVKKMRDNSSAGYNTDPTKNTFKRERYGDPSEGKEEAVTRDQILNYLYDEKIGNIQKSTAWQTTGDDGGGETTEESGILHHLSKNWHWYALVTVALVALAGVIWWKNISEWWNGPAEESGEGKVDEDEKNEEEE